MNQEFVVWLEDITQGQDYLVGRKAFGLATAARSGLLTPDGFCLTVKAYHAFIENHKMDQKIADILGEIDPDSMDQIEEGGRQIHRLFEGAELLDPVIREIESAYERLGKLAVAIRSSATVEDMQTASFAGQYESYLNIIGVDSILEAVKRCWGSLWMPRAIRYRSLNDVYSTHVGMAVLIQEMVDADTAGVMFTMNPLNGRTDEIVINAAYGLGELVVDGSVTPDTFIIRKNPYTIVSRVIGSKEIMAVGYVEGSTQKVVVPVDKQNEASLSNQEILELASIAREVEQLFGSAQDVEWACAQKRIYLLQARPVTSSVRGNAYRGKQYGFIKRFLYDFLLDYFPTPPYQFDRSILLSLVDKTLQLAGHFGLKPAKSSDVLKENTDGTLSLVPVLPRITWRTLPCLMTGSAKALLSLRVDPEIWQRETWPEIEQCIDILLACDVSEMSNEELLDIIHQSLTLRDEGIFASRSKYILGGWVAMGLLPLVLKMLHGKGGGQIYSNLMSGLDHPTSRMNQELRGLARLATQSTCVRELLEQWESESAGSGLEDTVDIQLFKKAVNDFLANFGARTGMLMPAPSTPSWGDNPIVVFSLVRSMLSDPSFLQKDMIGSQNNRSSEAYERTIKLASRFPFMLIGLQPVARFLIKHVKAISAERDWVIYAYELATQPIRRSMHEIGRRLVRMGVLIKPEDIRLLSLEDASEALINKPGSNLISQIQLQVKKRKLARIRSQINWRGVSADHKSSGEDLFLEGIAASPGIAYGPAQIILSDQEFRKLNVGDLLVCRATNPGWTPLFAIASGVVADTGGPLSHAAIVAREYGIPAVLGTRSATLIMKAGETYLVDGTRGQVVRTHSDSQPLKVWIT